VQIGIKDFAVQMEVKNRGVEFEVKDTKGKHLGDLVITKTSVIWCKGRTGRARGKSLSWDRFIKMMSPTRPAAAPRKVATRPAAAPRKVVARLAAVPSAAAPRKSGNES